MMPDVDDCESSYDQRAYSDETEDYYPWDCDNSAAGEAETFDLLDDGEDEDE